MRDYDNIVEKFKHDKQTLFLGLSIMSEALTEQIEALKESDASEDKKIELSNKVKEYLTMSHKTMEHMAKTYIPDQLDHDEREYSTRLRKANETIRELELKLGEKASVEDITHTVKMLEDKILNILKNMSVYACVDVTFNKYSVEAKLRFIHSLKESSYYVDTQEEIDEINEANKVHHKRFQELFDVSGEKNDEMKMAVTEKNINLIKREFQNHGFNFDINKVETDRFHSHFDGIDTIVLTQSLDNFSLSFERSIYHEDV